MTSAAAVLLAGCSGQDVAEADPQVVEPVETARPATPRPAPTLEETARTEADTRAATRERSGGLPTLAGIAEPQLSTMPLTDNIDAMMGPGGNIAVLYTDAGALVVDDKFERFGDEILARVAARGGAAPAYVLNTHFHGDHTGSNVRMRQAGATVVAQDGTLDLMTSTTPSELFGQTREPREDAALPDITFGNSMNLRFGGETVSLTHAPAGHTGGDMLVHFVNEDVLHMGDTLFNGMWPVIDIEAGGSLEGMIAAQGAGLRLADEDTVIVPGHGEITDREGLEASRAIMIELRDIVRARIDAGDTLEEVLEANPVSEFGFDGGFINDEAILRTAYRSLSESQP